MLPTLLTLSPGQRCVTQSKRPLAVQAGCAHDICYPTLLCQHESTVNFIFVFRHHMQEITNINIISPLRLCLCCISKWWNFVCFLSCSSCLFYRSANPNPNPLLMITQFTHVAEGKMNNFPSLSILLKNRTLRSEWKTEGSNSKRKPVGTLVWVKLSNVFFDCWVIPFEVDCTIQPC